MFRHAILGCTYWFQGICDDRSEAIASLCKLLNLVVDASSKIHFSPFAPQARTMSSSEDDNEGGRIRFTTEGDYEDGQWMDDGEFYARGEVSVGV